MRKVGETAAQGPLPAVVSAPDGLRSVPALTSFDGVIFDMDGVITDTTVHHFKAWAAMLDAITEESDSAPLTDEEYRRHIDGRPRIEGAAALLSERRRFRPLGTDDDPPGVPTVWGAANLKDEYFRNVLTTQRAKLHRCANELLATLATAGVPLALVTSSRNRDTILAPFGLVNHFATVIDGLSLRDLGLPGKPDPASFIVAARDLGTSPSRTAVIEDSVAGVAAGRSGGFGLVIGVDRTDKRARLMMAGADLVVTELCALIRPLLRSAKSGTESFTRNPTQASDTIE